MGGGGGGGEWLRTKRESNPGSVALETDAGQTTQTNRATFVSEGVCGRKELLGVRHVLVQLAFRFESGAGIMVVDERQVTTVFTVQPTFHHRHSTNRVS